MLAHKAQLENATNKVTFQKSGKMSGILDCPSLGIAWISWRVSSLLALKIWILDFAKLVSITNGAKQKSHYCYSWEKREKQKE